jgi:alpha-1,6-mannosyltransferase
MGVGMVKPGWAAVRLLLRGCRAVFTASRAEFATLVVHGVKEVHCVPFGVDRTQFHPRGNAGETRARLHVAPGQRLLIAGGRLAAEKRWDIAIEAMRHLADAKLIIVGDGPERARLEVRAATLPEGRVSLVPFVKSRNDFAELLCAADAYVHACPYETFGLTVGEAVACGTPVVVPDRGGAQESGAGGAHFLYRALDSQAMARAIELALAHGVKQQAIALAAHARDEKDHVAEVLSTYETLLARGGEQPS